MREASFVYQSPLSANLTLTVFPRLVCAVLNNSRKLHYKERETKGELNTVTRQGNEVTSATWVVPIRCVSLRKLEKRFKKAAEDEFADLALRNRDTSQWLR